MREHFGSIALRDYGAGEDASPTAGGDGERVSALLLTEIFFSAMLMYNSLNIIL